MALVPAMPDSHLRRFRPCSIHCILPCDRQFRNKTDRFQFSDVSRPIHRDKMHPVGCILSQSANSYGFFLSWHQNHPSPFFHYRTDIRNLIVGILNETVSRARFIDHHGKRNGGIRNVRNGRKERLRQHRIVHGIRTRIRNGNELAHGGFHSFIHFGNDFRYLISGGKHDGTVISGFLRSLGVHIGVVENN